MQRFRYKAVNLQKQTIRGTFLAQNEEELAQQLAKQSLYLISARRESAKPVFSGIGKVTTQELTDFCRQFSLMLSTGIPILDCLDILRHQQNSGHFRGVLSQVYGDVKSGCLLSEAFGNRQGTFPPFFRSMISVRGQRKTGCSPGISGRLL